MQKLLSIIITFKDFNNLSGKISFQGAVKSLKFLKIVFCKHKTYSQNIKLVLNFFQIHNQVLVSKNKTQNKCKKKAESKIKTGISYKNHHQKKNSNANPVYIYILYFFYIFDNGLEII